MTYTVSMTSFVRVRFKRGDGYMEGLVGES